MPALVVVAPYTALVLAATAIVGARLTLTAVTGSLLALGAVAAGVIVLDLASRLLRVGHRRRCSLVWSTAALLIGVFLSVFLVFDLQRRPPIWLGMTLAGLVLVWTTTRALYGRKGRRALVVRFLMWILALAAPMSLGGGRLRGVGLSVAVVITAGLLVRWWSRIDLSWPRIDLRSWWLNVGASVCSVVVSIVLVFVFASDLIFDALIYRKSARYGYFPPGIDRSSTKYGSRSADIAALRNAMRDLRESPEAESPDAAWLRAEVGDKFVVAVIGDSFVWGQGLLNRTRFVTLLSEKLNRIRPTRVLSFANSGDNLMENLIKYEASRRIVPDVDLYVFGVVTNDLLLNRGPPRYDGERFEELLALCRGPFLEEVDQGLPEDRIAAVRRTSLDADSGYGNRCFLTKLAGFLPKDALYLFFWDHETSDFEEELKAAGLVILKAAPRLREMLVSAADWRVSPADGHPSALANVVFADVLYEEIVSNPNHGFAARRR